MRYTQTGVIVKLGDHVVVEGNVKGIVVCDFDEWRCLPGYEDWLTQEELLGGGYLDSGVMIETTELGPIHYPEEDEDISFAFSSDESC